MTARSGVCVYCGVTDDQVDGDRLSWHNAACTCCSKYACVTQYHREQRERQAALLRMRRKPSPAEVHQLILARGRRRRRKGRAA